MAGGKGTRIGSEVPKQFMELLGRPVLLHTLDCFFRYSESIAVVLVLPEDQILRWHALCEKFHFSRPVILQAGGYSRFQSVKNGLEKVNGPGLVAIHDGVRPLVSTDIIAASFRLAAQHRSAVAAVRLKESIRLTDKDSTHAADRSLFRIIQTPQTFDIATIKRAYGLPEDASLTDDASVAERAGLTISLFEGSYENIKITTPEDLVVAEALLKAKKKAD